MATSFIDTNNDPFAAISQDVSAQRKQIAQYAIMQAATYMQNGQNDQAIGAFKKALAIDSQNSTAYNYLGKIYLSQGKNTDAIKAYQQLVRMQSNIYLADSSANAPTVADAHTSLGNAYLQDKQYTPAENEFKTAAKLASTNPLPVYTLGHLYANRDRLPEAETQFLKVKQISPNDGNVYYSLGMVYNKQGKYEDAVANLEKALDLKRTFPDANYELGLAYNALGRNDDAKKQLTILHESGSSQAQDLGFALEKPGIISMDTKTSGGFSESLGPATPLWMLDPTLLIAPNSSKAFSVTIQFSNQMDAASITNSLNWSISRSYSEEGGYYNKYEPLTSKEVALPANPESVRYNSFTHEAVITFRLAQNTAGDAKIDPSHLNFKFSGKDAHGREMDQAANEITGYSVSPF